MPDATGQAAGHLADRLLERDAELQVLTRSLREAAAGSGCLVLVEGEAGVGKSTLLAALAEEAARRGFTRMWARGRELERNVPFGVARELLAATTGGRPPAFAALPPAPGRADGPPPPGVDARAPMIEALADAVEELAGGGPGDRSPPLLVAVDDAHWADGSSLRLLAHLADRAERLRLVVTIALRVDLPDAAVGDIGWLRTRPGARVLCPRPLGGSAVERLVRQRLPRAVPQFVDTCAEVTGGNPFLLHELVAVLAEDEVEGTADDEPRARLLVPDSVLRSVLARLGRLPAAAAELAAAVAVLGEASLRHAAAIAELEPEAAARAADALVDARLLCPVEPLRFVHPLVASAVHADSAPFARARRHRRAAVVLAQDGASAARIAGHLMAACPAGDAWVVGMLREAAAGARAAGEPAAAARLLLRALAEPPAPGVRADVLLELGRAEAAAGEDGALPHLHEAMELLDNRSRRAAAALELATLLFARLDVRAAAAVAERGLREAAERGDVATALRAIQLTAAALSPTRGPAVERVAALHREALDGRLPSSPEMLALVALTASCAGSSPALVRRAVERALANAPADPAIAEMTLLLFVPLALAQIDELDAAESFAEAALERAERAGRVLAAAFARQSRGRVLWEKGRLREAAAQAERALAARSHGWEAATAQSAAVLAHVRLDLGEHDAARAAVAVGAGPSSRVTLPLLLHARGRLALAEGDPRRALEDFSAAGRYLEEAFAIRNPAVLPWRSSAARAAHRLGDEEGARRLAAAEVAEARQVGLARPLGVALCTLGTVGPPEHAVDVLREAVACLEESPARLEHARALLELGAALRRRGLRAAAQQPLAAALEAAERAGAVPLAERARHELRASGRRPRRPARSGPDALTATERRVAELAAQGLTSREIAAELVVTTRTVEWHLNHVYRKLGIRARGDLAAKLTAPPREDVAPRGPAPAAPGAHGR